MFRHEGVSCDLCCAYNFRGKRFKCLKCKDYDLCMNCFDLGLGTHSRKHPFQCILTQSDYELFYGGESSPCQRSFTCSICGQMGFAEKSLVKHALECHRDVSTPVLCPVCITLPQNEPNVMIVNFSNHLVEMHGKMVYDFNLSSTSTETRSTPVSQGSMDTLTEIFSQLVLTKKKKRSAHRQSIWGPLVPKGLHHATQAAETSAENTVQIPPAHSSKMLVDEMEIESETEEKNEARDESLAARNLFARHVVTSTFNDPNLRSLRGDLGSFVKEQRTLEFEDVFSDIDKK
ncbi:E3 ubiquitin-protein ligase KCMF1-like [Cimex lectularius]|uniref:RING-type E3 ubiquitin transferase n=1 Tax=Cimex lectularius TaxID=79782 RepID=A0A8I6SBC5_CIMLE|nr:E3 ubiquitin-protein ligase KCMF1-like [Cimex lectularius]